MEEVEVPSYFVCPISLQIMKDPVTLPTGITYDRESIEKWLFSTTATAAANKTCPLTNQILPSDPDLTPNHTLRRLAQAWCEANASKGTGIERFPTPRPPVDRLTILSLLQDHNSSANSLRKLRELVAFSDRNRRCAEAAGAVEALISVVVDKHDKSSTTTHEALALLNALRVSDDNIRNVVAKHDDDVVSALVAILQQSSNLQSRTYALFLLKLVFAAVSPVRLIAVKNSLFFEIVKIIGDQISRNATKVALWILAELCHWGKNRVKAVGAGAVREMVELLLEETSDKKIVEMSLIVLELLCGCAEGRAELLRHAAGVAVVAKSINGVSNTATERAVRVIYSVGKYSASPALVKEMLQLGVVSKLYYVLHLECGVKTKEKAKELLRLHSRVWRDSPCIAQQFLASYPK